MVWSVAKEKTEGWLKRKCGVSLIPSAAVGTNNSLVIQSCLQYRQQIPVKPKRNSLMDRSERQKSDWWAPKGAANKFVSPSISLSVLRVINRLFKNSNVIFIVNNTGIINRQGGKKHTIYGHPLTFLNPRWPLKLKPDWFSPRAWFINFSFAILYCIRGNKFNNFGLKVIILRHRGSRQKTSGWWFYIIAHIWFLQRQCIITKCVFIVLKRELKKYGCGFTAENELLAHTRLFFIVTRSLCFIGKAMCCLWPGTKNEEIENVQRQ